MFQFDRKYRFLFLKKSREGISNFTSPSLQHFIKVLVLKLNGFIQNEQDKEVLEEVGVEVPTVVAGCDVT